MWGGMPSAPAPVRRTRCGSTRPAASGIGTRIAVSAIARLYDEGLASVRIAPDGPLLRPLPRLQGLAHRRAGGARAAARRRAYGGRWRDRRREHLLRHERGAREVAPGGLPSCAHASAGLRDGVRRPSVRDGFLG